MSWRGAIKAGTDTAVDIIKENAKVDRAAELYQTKRQNSMTDAMELFNKKAVATADAATGVLDSNYGYKNLKEFNTQINAQAEEAIGKSAVERHGKVDQGDITRNARSKSTHAAELSKMYKTAYTNGMRNLTIPTISDMMLQETARQKKEQMTGKMGGQKWVASILGSYKNPVLEGLLGNIPPDLVEDRVRAQKNIDALIANPDPKITKEMKTARLIQLKKAWKVGTGLEW